MEQRPDNPPPTGPRASVVIPAYRRTDELRALLDSLARDAATAGDVEVVLSDDGSGPEVAELAASYVSRFTRFKYITGENAGPGVARNRGVAAASSDILLFVDSDCLVLPGWIDGLSRAIEAGAAIAFGPTSSAVPPIEPFVHAFSFEETMNMANIAFARRTYEALGGFRADLSRVAEDRDLFARTEASGVVPVRVAAAVVDHPPRRKAIRLPSVLGDHPHFSALRAFYSSYPEVRSHDRRASRALLAKGALKLLLGVTPFGLPTFIAQAMWKRRDVNRRLEAADVDWRVPARDAIKYGLFQPVNDILLAVQSLQMTGL